jgi:glycine/D-amino acid oxidase-like deaminating enzyme
MHVLICGGGVVGASIAYFLSRRGVAVTVIERTGVACAASGKSGGFLAAEWCDGTPVQRLARRSFDLHAELATELGGDWGYRRMTTYGGHADLWEHGHRRGYDIGWLSDNVVVSQQIGSTANTAQVTPAAFTRAMMQAAEANGAVLHIARVTGVRRAGDKVTGVELEGGEVIAGDAVVIAMGPWSILAAMWLPLPAVHGLKGHSLVFDTGASVPAEAAFLEYREAGGETLTPELFPRPDGTTYVCGVSSEQPLPLDPAQVEPEEAAIERLERMCGVLSPVLSGAPIIARQACFRPIARDGVPVIGRAPGVEGAYIATGHSVWGILNAPATGEAMAELILDGAARQVDLAPFSPTRLPRLDPTRLRQAMQG